MLIIKIPWRVSDYETGLLGWKCSFFPISYIYIYILTIFKPVECIEYQKKQTGSQTVLDNCAQSCFYQYMQITYPFADFPSNWNILAFFPTFRFALCHFIFLKAEFFYMNLCFQKEKTFRKCVFIQPRRYITIMFISFASLFYPYIQIPLHPADFAGGNSVAFDFSDACLFGQPVYNYFDYQYFLSFALNFYFNLWKFKKCTWKIKQSLRSHYVIKPEPLTRFWTD